MYILSLVVHIRPSVTMADDVTDTWVQRSEWSPCFVLRGLYLNTERHSELPKSLMQDSQNHGVPAIAVLIERLLQGPLLPSF